MVKGALVVLAACSGARAKVEDSKPAPVVTPKPADAAAVVAPASGAGDVSIRVEWHDVPAALRASPGRTACGTAARAHVAPTVTWGIPDAVVIVSGERAKPLEASAKLVFDHCALSPRAVIAGDSLAVTSTATQPAELAVARHKDPRTGATEPARKLALPIAGHQVDVALEAGGWYELAAGDDSAWVFSAPKAYAGVTDATGVFVARDVPVGTYTVNAWFPPYAKSPPRGAQAQVTVTAGALAEVTLDIGK